MKTHQWRENGEAGTTFYRACHHAGRWTLFLKGPGAEGWEEIDPPEREDWERLREVLWRKYQRGRCPWKLVEKIDRLLEEEE